jgi:DNA-binding transcriptional LysR family regulator
MDDIRTVDLNLLRSLDVLIEEANVTRAASRLGLTQPGLSAQLARLRDIFGDPLLVPSETGRGMVPTRRALEIREPLRVALKDLAAVVRQSPRFDPLTDARSFAIATSDNAAIVLGLPLIERVRAAAGAGVRISFIGSSAAISSQLERGDIDLLIASERALPPAMKARKLLDESYVMVQRKDHPRGQGALDLDAYCALDHVLVSTSGGSFHGFIDEQLEQLGHRRNVALSVHQFIMAPMIVAATDFVSTLPRRLAMRFADRLDLVDLPFPAKGFSLFAAWHPRAHGDSALSWLRQQLIAVAAR